MIKLIPRFRPSLDWRSLGIILNKIFLYGAPLQQGGVRRFETDFAGYIGMRHAVIVPSGRVGLYLILKHLGLKEKTEIILPSFTYWAVPATVKFLNLNPVFVDINRKTCNLDPELVLNKITKNTKVIIPTHLYGVPCDMDAIIDIARKHSLIVVEDCVQALGAEYKCNKVGSMGDAAYFSFGITKNMPLLGGGMIVTNNDKLANQVRQEVLGFSYFDRKMIINKIILASAMKILTSPFVFSLFLYHLIRLTTKVENDSVGNIFSEKESTLLNFTPDLLRLMPYIIQEDVGHYAFSRIDSLNSRRIYNGKFVLKHLKVKKEILLPPVFEKNIFTSFPIQIKDRNLMAIKLLKKGIDTSRGYMKAHGEDCPNARNLEQEILHIPIYPSLKESELVYMCEVMNCIFKG